MNEELDIQRSERIHAYVQGTMADAERAAFELDLAADAVLRADVEVERTLHSAIQREPELRFRQLVQRVSAAQEQGGGGLGTDTPVIQIGRRANLRWLAIAASVLVLLGASVWLFNERLAGPDYRGLALAELDQPLNTIRSAGHITDRLDSLQQVAIKQLLAGKHIDFLRYSSRLLEDPTYILRHGDRTRLDRSYALLKLDRPADARAELKALESTEAGVQGEAAYYTALSFLLEGDEASAGEALRDVNAPFPWDERMKRLREQLGR